MFACADDGLGHAVLLGYHDGVDSWTLNAAADPSGSSHEFVSRHEAAHHTLHSTTAWGIAMLAAGTPDRVGDVAGDAWQRLGLACRRTHEAFATFASVRRTRGGFERLAGNLTYLSYLRDAETLAQLVADDEVGAVMSDLLLRLMMSPVALLHFDVSDLRDVDAMKRLSTEDAPDRRLARLLDAVAWTSEAASVLVSAAVPDDDGRIDTARVAAVLGDMGIPTADFGIAGIWTRARIGQLQEEGRRSYLLVQASGSVADLDSIVDDQQRERLRIHDEPLPLQVVEPDDTGAFPASEFARTADGFGPHVWLCWLGPLVLRRQFTVKASLPAAEGVGLLSCNRVRGPAYASWLPMPGIEPGVAARLTATTKLRPLLFTTLRTLDSSPPDADFRGWEPSVVLLDSDVLAFLRRSSEDENGMRWSVVGSAGDRAVDTLVFERPSAPGVFYLYVCSAPTGRTVAAWLRAASAAFIRDDAPFAAMKPMLWAVIEHLLGTFWIFDLHGSGD